MMGRKARVLLHQSGRTDCFTPPPPATTRTTGRFLSSQERLLVPARRNGLPTRQHREKVIDWQYRVSVDYPLLGRKDSRALP